MSEMNTSAAPSDGAPSQSESDPVDAAKEMAISAGNKVKQEASNFADSVKDRAHDQIDKKKVMAGDMLGDMAAAMRRAGEELGERDKAGTAEMFQKAASGLETLARNVSEKRPEQLLHSAREMTRRNPAPVAASAVLVGFAIGRFFRSSTPQEEGPDAASAPSMSGNATSLSSPTSGAPSGLASTPQSTSMSGSETSAGTSSGAADLFGARSEPSADPSTPPAWTEG